MKRALTLMLVVAVIGGLTFMGLAGTAAAADNNDGIDVNIEGGDATNTANVDQTNNNAQTGIAGASAYGHGSSASAVVDQDQKVSQFNYASVDQTAEGGDGISIDF